MIGVRLVRDGARQPRWRSAALLVTRGLACCLLIACSEDRGDGRGFAGGEVGVIPPCPTRQLECPEAGAPSYEKDVLPILESRCIGCHSDGGVAPANRWFTSEASVCALQTTIRKRLSDCSMPPPPLPRVTDEEFATISCWARAAALAKAKNEPCPP